MNGKFVLNQGFTDKSFDAFRSTDYRLTILLREDGFSYVLAGKDDGKLIGLGDYSLEFRLQANANVRSENLLKAFNSFVMNHPWLGKPFHQPRILVSHRWVTLVPAPLYDESQKELYLAFNLPVPEGFAGSADYLPDLDAWCVYALNEDWNKQLPLLITGATIRHAASAFILSGLLFCRLNRISEAVVIQPGTEWFEIAYFARNTLVFYNTFHYTTSEDFIYFVLFVLEQLNLNPEITPVWLAGDVEAGSPLHNILTRYIRQVNFPSRPESLRWTFEFDEVPGHYFYTLIYSQLCEL
ncbi:MAG: DUF3822 family protein [Bacteroidales bacterium]